MASFTPDYKGIDAFSQFYTAYPNGAGGDGLTIDPEDGNIYQYYEAVKTFEIIKTIADKDTTDQYNIESDKVAADAVRILASSGGIDINASLDINTNSSADINSECLTEEHKITTIFKIVDETDAELMTIDKSGMSVKVPLTTEQGMDNQISEESLTIGTDTSAAGDRSINFMVQQGVTANITSLTASTNTISQDAATLSNGEFFQVRGTVYNDGVYKVLSGGGTASIVVDDTFNAIEQNEVPGSAVTDLVLFEVIKYSNTSGNFEFTDNIILEDLKHIGNASNPTLLQLNTNDIKVNGNLVINDASFIGNSSSLSIIQLNTGDVTLSKKLLVTDATASSDKDTGSGIFGGGVGVEENINAGGSINAAGALTGLTMTATNDITSTSGNLIVGGGNIGTSTDGDVIQLADSLLTINGNTIVPDDSLIGNGTNVDLLKLEATSLVVDGSIQSVSGLIGNSNDTDLLSLSDNILIINGDLQVESGNIGLSTDLDLMTMATGALTLNGSLSINSPTGETGEVYNILTAQTVGAVSDTVNLLALSSDEAANVEIKVIAQTSDFSNRGSYHLEGLFYESAGSAVQEGGSYSFASIESNILWDCDFAVNSNNIQVTVTGDTGETIDWKIIVKHVIK